MIKRRVKPFATWFRSNVTASRLQFGLNRNSGPHDPEGEFGKRRQILCKQCLQGELGAYIHPCCHRRHDLHLSSFHFSSASSGASSSSSGGARTGEDA